MRLLLLPLLLAGCLSACGESTTASDGDSEAAWFRAEFRSITLQRTVCYGTCPAYTVTIHADGLVEYQGEEHVAVTGEQRGTVEPAALDALVEQCRALDFFALADEYRTKTDAEGNVVMITDAPSRYTTLRVGEHEKRVHNYFGGPAALRALEDAIDEAAGTARWVGPR